MPENGRLGRAIAACGGMRYYYVLETGR